MVARTDLQRELLLKNKKYIGVIIMLSGWSGVYFYIFILTPFFVMAQVCTAEKCDGVKLPSVVTTYIEQGYSEIRTLDILNKKYLMLTSAGDVNKCSVLFEVKADVVDEVPIKFGDRKVCNLSVVGKYVTSSWRDKGMWNEDVYEIAHDGKWHFLFKDECVGCQQVKRSLFKNGQLYKTQLLSDSVDFSSRKELSGKVNVVKAYLYAAPDDKSKLKAYLIEGDVFMLIDMSDDGEYYKVKYKSLSGKTSFYWIRSDDFLLN